MSLGKHIKLLLDLFWRPAIAMSTILDRGSLLFGSVSVLAVKLLTSVAARRSSPSRSSSLRAWAFISP